ncbi:Protein trichome birefringence-like 10 [Sarracenia purpurea var. burkii]
MDLPLYIIDMAGDWKTGGSCHLETLPDFGSFFVSSQTWVHAKIIYHALTERFDKSPVNKLDLLNVTYMTSLRKDGHSSLYYLGPEIGPAPLHRQDCSHWCLPGVPDSWNELLYALFLRWEYSHRPNSINAYEGGTTSPQDSNESRLVETRFYES